METVVFVFDVIRVLAGILIGLLATIRAYKNEISENAYILWLILAILFIRL